LASKSSLLIACFRIPSLRLFGRSQLKALIGFCLFTSQTNPGSLKLSGFFFIGFCLFTCQTNPGSHKLSVFFFSSLRSLLSISRNFCVVSSCFAHSLLLGGSLFFRPLPCFERLNEFDSNWS